MFEFMKNSFVYLVMFLTFPIYNYLTTATFHLEKLNNVPFLINHLDNQAGMNMKKLSLLDLQFFRWYKIRRKHNI